MFSDVDEKEIKSIKNEADLFNKASQIRNKILTDIERKLKDDKEEKIKKAQEELRNRDTVFVDERERISRIKAGIMSAMNRAIENRDVKAMDELKGLIERLEAVLFGG